MRLFVLFAASAAALGACSPDAVAPSEPQNASAGLDHPGMGGETPPVPAAQTIEAGGQAATFENAWIRTPPAGRDIAAGYVAISTREPDVLLRAESGAAERIELHTMTMDGDVMRMRRADRIEIGEGGAMLEPGGDHLMIFGLSETASLSGPVVIELHLESGLTAPVEFQVGDRMPGDHH